MYRVTIRISTIWNLEQYSMVAEQIVKYIIVGVISNVVSFAIYLFLSSVSEFVGLSASIGALVGVVITYFASGKWIFPSKNNINKYTALKYFSMYAFFIAFMGAITDSLTNIVNLNYIVSWFLAAGTVATLNFLGMKFFVFRNDK